MFIVRIFASRLVVQGVPTLLGILTVLFLLVRLLPGDPASVLLGPDAAPGEAERLRNMLGLDQPLMVQYARFLVEFMTGDWGVSYASNTPVIERIADALPATLGLAAAALIIVVTISIPAGILCAVHRGKALDATISITVFFLMSMPQFWFGIMLLLVFAYWLPAFPIFQSQAELSFFEDLRHVALPAIALSVTYLGLATRLTRSSMIDELAKEYVQTARAKGVAEWRVVIQHALPNGLVPVITVMALTMGQLLGAAVVIEVVFVRPGLGTLIWTAVTQRDYPLIQGAIAVFAVLFMLSNLMADLAYALVDPRVRTS